MMHRVSLRVNINKKGGDIATKGAYNNDLRILPNKKDILYS